jgi:regulator of sigma E protease
MEELARSAITIVLFFLILGGLVLIHELGHFVTARMANVRVLEFGIGFPPRAKVLRSKGETLYTLNWLPIGGFVKLEGEDGDQAEDPRSFAAQRTPVKLIILAAGVLMNLLTAFVIFTFIAWLATPLTGLRFSEVDENSPAQAAGLQPGMAILAVNGVEREFFGDGSVLTDLQDNAGETVTLTVQRPDGSVYTVDATLRTQTEIDASRDEDGVAQKGPLGISGGEAGFEPVFYGTASRDLPTALAVAGEQTVYWFGLILAGLGELVGGFVNNPTAAPPVSGPVGIATQIGDIFFNAGPILTLYVAGVLSANLALVNSLPFPPLDGGRALMIVLKAIFGTRISLRAERLTYVVGFVVLFAFLIWVTGFDILRALNGNPT